MYFLEQIKKQFCSTIALYQEAPDIQGHVEGVEAQGPDLELPRTEVAELRMLAEEAKPIAGGIDPSLDDQRGRIRIAEGVEGAEVVQPVSLEAYAELRETFETDMHIPEEMETEIMEEVMRSLETEGLDPEQIEQHAQGLFIEAATRLKVEEFSTLSLEDRERILDGEDIPSIRDEIDRIAEETGIDSDILARAMAQNMDGFGLDVDGVPLEEMGETLSGSITDFAGNLEERIDAYRVAHPDREFNPNNPEDMRELYSSALGQNVVTGTVDDTSLSPDAPSAPGYMSAPPAGVPANPGVNRYTGEGLGPVGEAYVGDIELNPEFYGEQLIADFSNLERTNPEIFRSAEVIMEAFNLSASQEESGWALPVMRNAVNSAENGKIFSDSQVFMAHDIGTQTSGIYDPASGEVRYVPSSHGRGVGNVSGSYATPLGSFTIAQYVPPASHSRYSSALLVHGMEPMNQDMGRTPREQARSYDPGVGNVNSNAREILIHNGLRTTLGCTGMNSGDCSALANAVISSGGQANFEVFISTGSSSSGPSGGDSTSVVS